METNRLSLENIGKAHAKVKSGSDFPAYIRALSALGVTSYETFVSDGRTAFHGKEGFHAETSARYESLDIAAEPALLTFTEGLRAHQQGKTDYQAFCRLCARSGVDKWIVDLETMECVYYDTAGNKVLAEKIPA